ncbi:MAG: hypothetical protein A2W11_13910 [Ignavibacteria bacterium RBG_16_35_7]|nr:MAG: hypothetical protein A2W11_13910 [Ignavibacteria bacterium RBG_16_35_7]
MLRLNKYFLFIVILTVTSYSQETVEQRRNREHQAVIDYINRTYPNYPVNTNQSLGSDKSIGLNLFKPTVRENPEWKRYLMNGNNVAVEIWNYGGIGPGLPGDALRDILGLVWRDAPYIFQFSPIIGASVPNALNPSNKFHIISDGLYDFSQAGLRDENTSIDHQYWWQPLPGFADPNQDLIASNPTFDSDRDGKPDSWPREWYNATLGEYVWPGYLVQGENNADLEVLWSMDDRENNEFGIDNQVAQYFPFVNDSARSGLGIQVLGRGFQWANSLASNSIFFQWSLTNVSDKPLDKVVFGIYGDPDLGGNDDNQDDNGLFIPPTNMNIPVYARNMVYFFDPDGVGELNVPLGYLGCKFLESPGNPVDGIDNDGDGMIDERQDDGIDNDLDWNLETDDVGIDGIPNTGDFGEGNGAPTAGQRLPDGSPDPLQPGEPNFEYTDLDESDQIGLTSFNSSTWNTDLKIANDEDIWNRCIPGNFGDIEQTADIVFIFGSGYISLAPGETKRISMAFLFGENLNDLLVTAETVQEIYNKNYRFFKPPTLPKVAAVPDDKKVTLYWDASSEESVDPITGKDFEGYVIYRSTRPDFADIQVITDGHASSFLYEPLRDLDGFETKWDLNNEWRGYHPVPYQGRGLHYYLGDNTGLIHSFVDSNNVINGQTYYYAVVSYDHGDSLGIPPSETTKKITVDPITGQTIFNDNTVMVIPGPRASGYNTPEISNIDFQHPSGIGNGDVEFQILNDLEIKDETYTLTFSDTLNIGDSVITAKNYSVKGEKSITESFFLFDTKFANLSKQNIINDETLQVKDKNGVIYQNDVDFIIDYEQGKIRRTDNSSMPNNSEFTITYHNYAVYQSQALHEEDSNPVFDGILLKIADHNILEFDPEKSSWIGGDLEIPFTAQLSTIGVATRKMLYPADYDITFSDQNEYTAIKNVPGTGFTTIPVNFKVEEVTSGVSRPILVFLNEKEKNDSAFTRGDGLVLFKPSSTGVNTDTLTWEITISKVITGDSVYPGSGDVLRISTKRPFNKQDVFSLETNAGTINQQAGASLLDNIYVVPNPYVGSSVLEPDNKLPSQNRGERRIYFENLPMKCTIRIFTLSGELVTTLEHNEGMDNGREYWNLLNRDGFSVAYGIYIAHIEAPNIGEKLIKFALIK